MNVSALSAADLLAVYNIAAAASVKRFATRAVGEKRLAAALADPEARGRLARAGACPACGDRHNGITVGRINKAGQETHQHEAMCHVCGHEFHADTGAQLKARAATNCSASAAIAASWKDPEVRAARIERCPVRVVTPAGNTLEFRSMRPAFAKLGLPMGVMIRTRMNLKVARSLDFQGYKFYAI